MENNAVKVVRKGTWTPEEDDLLRKCIQTYGEGRWHLVPHRAGLNRCRKSCRLRWINYLKPDIKRGQFTKDEVDLLFRLHKLLGNRWSLIAGRIPGRTANDVKNFWNAHVVNKLPAAVAGKMAQQGKNVTQICSSSSSKLVRPRPRNFSNSLPPRNPTRGGEATETRQPQNVEKKERQPSDECMKWWANLLETASDNGLGGIAEMPPVGLEDAGEMDAAPDDGDADGFDFFIEEGAWKPVNFGDQEAWGGASGMSDQFQVIDLPK